MNERWSAHHGEPSLDSVYHCIVDLYFLFHCLVVFYFAVFQQLFLILDFVLHFAGLAFQVVQQLEVLADYTFIVVSLHFARVDVIDCGSVCSYEISQVVFVAARSMGFGLPFGR